MSQDKAEKAQGLLFRIKRFEDKITIALSAFGAGYRISHITIDRVFRQDTIALDDIEDKLFSENMLERYVQHLRIKIDKLKKELEEL